jgi:hypothetical protein
MDYVDPRTTRETTFIIIPRPPLLPDVNWYCHVGTHGGGILVLGGLPSTNIHICIMCTWHSVLMPPLSAWRLSHVPSQFPPFSFSYLFFLLFTFFFLKII